MIVIQFNDRYHRWGVLFLRALALHEPRRRVLADTVGLTPEQAAQVRAAHPRVIQVDSPAPPEGTGRDAMICRKCHVLLRVMRDYPRDPWFALMDVDLLIRSRLTQLWAAMRWTPMVLVPVRPRGSGGSEFTSGLVLVRQDARPFVESWAKWDGAPVLEGLERLRYHWNELALTAALNETQPRYAVVRWRDYDDWTQQPSALVWSAGADTKDADYPGFLAEHERQLREARVRIG